MKEESNLWNGEWDGYGQLMESSDHIIRPDVVLYAV